MIKIKNVIKHFDWHYLRVNFISNSNGIIIGNRIFLDLKLTLIGAFT